MSKRSEIINALRICAKGCCSERCMYAEIAGSNGGIEDRNCASYLAEDVLSVFAPHKPSMKKLQCVCGSKRRELWNGPDYQYFKCSRCGIKGYDGRTELEAVIGWNRMIMDKTNA